MSKITPRSLVECLGTSSLPFKVRRGVINLECFCLLPNIISLVICYSHPCSITVLRSVSLIIITILNSRGKKNKIFRNSLIVNDCKTDPRETVLRSKKREIKIPEFELLGSNCTTLVPLDVKVSLFLLAFYFL